MPTEAVTRFAEIMETEGRTYAWLSRQTGISRVQLSNYSRGLHCPEDRQRAIAETLGRKIEDVFPQQVPA